LIGARTDTQYGPFLMVGLGGIFVEVLEDVSLRLLPVDEKEARAMLKE
jgi:acyl-CoA synthetase (NDP forming)